MSKTYTIGYGVTRIEYYKIEADNAIDAEENAFEEGVLDESVGETTDVVHISTKCAEGDRHQK